MKERKEEINKKCKKESNKIQEENSYKMEKWEKKGAQ
jgi:hypothetical protein